MTKSETVLVKFSDSAVKKLKEIMNSQDMADSYLRIATITEGGRIEYSFDLQKEVDRNGTDSLIDGDIKAIVDANSVDLLKGSTIDYIESFEKSGFVVDNPNVEAGCPCGGKCGCN